MYSPRVTISLFCSYILILHITSSTVSPSLALKDCEFPAIFNFGDSNSDTGGLVASQLLPLTTTYGETYFHMLVGRFSDGRLIIDFLGFELPFVACCGDYNCNSSAECGATITVHGSQIFVGSCENPSARINWDGAHYTEEAAKFVFDQISTGAYSDPPLPLKEACHRSFK